MLQTLLKSGSGTNSTSTRSYIHGVGIACGAGASSITVRNGGSGGAIVFVMAIPTANSSQYVPFEWPILVDSIHITNSANTQESWVYYASES